MAVAALRVSAAADPEMPVVRFERAIELATRDNPQNLDARAEIARANALVEEARAVSLPSLTGTAGYTHLDGDRYAGTLLLAPENSFSLGAQLVVPIVVPVQWATWSHAKDDVASAGADAASVRRAVAIETSRVYLRVLAQQRIVAIATQARDAARAHYDYARTRSAGGLGNKLDDARALDELQRDEASLESAQTDLTRVREALGVLTGSRGPIDVDGDVVLRDLPQAGAVDDGALHRRADVRALEVRRDAAATVLNDSWREYAPSVVAVAGAAYNTPGTATQPETAWQAELVLSVPIYDGGARYGRRDERRANLDRSEIAIEGALREARSEVRTSYDAFARAQRSLVFARASEQAAQQALELATTAYRGGATSNLDVIDAERRARDAGVQVVIAEDAVRQAQLDALAAIGEFPW